MNMVLHFIVRVLEVMFFIGLAGSLVVAIAAFVGDIPVLYQMPWMSSLLSLPHQMIPWELALDCAMAR